MRKFILLFVGLIMAFTTALAQDCKVVISSITPTGPGSPPSAVHISVSGEVTGSCTRVSVTLCCLNPTGERTGCRTQSVSVVNGSWSTLFKDFICHCEGNSFTVVATARCLSNDCQPGEMTQTIPCSPTGNSCPMINGVAVTVGDCVDDGSGCKGRSVTFTPSVSGTSDGWSFNFGDNTLPVNGVGNPPPLTHTYYLFPPIDPVLTIFKVNCPPVSFPITNLAFQLCDECPPASGVTINVSSDRCVASGNIIASICEDNYLEFIIDFGDGNSITEDIAMLNGYTFNHTYVGDGTKTITITLIRSGNTNCTYTKTVSITNCCADCDDNDDDDDSSCGWRFWECFSLCWLLAILAGIYVSVRLILVAWGWSISLPIGSYTWAEILEALGLGLLLLLMAFCPCEAAYMIIAGATLAIVIIIVAMIAGAVPPKWLLAIILGIILIVSMFVLISEKGC